MQWLAFIAFPLTYKAKKENRPKMAEYEHAWKLFYNGSMQSFTHNNTYIWDGTYTIWVHEALYSTICWNITGPIVNLKQIMNLRHLMVNLIQCSNIKNTIQIHWSITKRQKSIIIPTIACLLIFLICFLFSSSVSFPNVQRVNHNKVNGYQCQKSLISFI